LLACNGAGKNLEELPFQQLGKIEAESPVAGIGDQGSGIREQGEATCGAKGSTAFC
jgi:hypothetical protein